MVASRRVFRGSQKRYPKLGRCLFRVSRVSRGLARGYQSRGAVYTKSLCRRLVTDFCSVGAAGLPYQGAACCKARSWGRQDLPGTVLDWFFTPSLPYLPETRERVPRARILFLLLQRCGGPVAMRTTIQEGLLRPVKEAKGMKLSDRLHDGASSTELHRTCVATPSKEGESTNASVYYESAHRDRRLSGICRCSQLVEKKFPPQFEKYPSSPEACRALQPSRPALREKQFCPRCAAR